MGILSFLLGKKKEEPTGLRESVKLVKPEKEIIGLLNRAFAKTEDITTSKDVRTIELYLKTATAKLNKLRQIRTAVAARERKRKAGA